MHATLWALERGVDLALANKESLVTAGELALAAQARGGGRILPVDSEHSAILQCLQGSRAGQVDALVLTASGGPFRGRTATSSRRDPRARRSHIRPGAWAGRSRSTPRRSRTRGWS